MADKEWVRVASEDDSMVAELLVKLKEAKPAPPPPAVAKPALSLEWKVRQRRSRAVAVPATMKAAPLRASPTTPLSWSGATSVSGGASFDGGAEEVSGAPFQAKRFDASRSKVIVGSSEAEASNSRKPKRKKTITELKEEGDLLDRERRHLNRELAAVRRKLEKERASNEKLKRIKMEVEAIRGDQIQTTQSHEPAAASNEVHREFVLPDLNIPIEDSSSCDAPEC